MAKSKRTKQIPNPKQNPSNSKQARRVEEPPSYHSKRPSWRIGLVELADPFGWHKIEQCAMFGIKEKLANFESMTWYEILVGASTQNHAIPIQHLCKHAKDRLTEIGQDDVDELVSLRLSGKERIWGILEEGVLRLLWWDPEHEVCPSPKKHT